MNDCPICNQALHVDDAIWSSEDGTLAHRPCVDALASIFLRTHLNARSSYTRTITENFMANARLALVRSGEVSYT
jgi:hypothetical protein